MPKLKFNTKIYKREALQKAISAYSSLAKFDIKNNRNYLEVKMERIEPKHKSVFIDEFCNYVLGMTKRCH